MHETMPVIHITHISFPAYTYTHGLLHAYIYMYTHAHTHNACITVPPYTGKSGHDFFSWDSCTLFPNAQHYTLFLQTMR